MDLLVRQEHRSRLQRAAKNFLLHFFHSACARLRPVIESVQMQQAMNNVQPQLSSQRVPKAARLALRCLRADKNFAVLKRQHIGRPWLLKELLV
jgi:hypothetical protein